MKLKLTILLLLICTGCMSALSQVNEKNIVLGEFVNIEAEEMVELEDGILVPSNIVHYSLFIKKVGIAEVDTIWFRKSAATIPMVDSIQTILVNGNFIDELGDYEIYGIATRFVELNSESNQWVDGIMSDILIAHVILDDDVRKLGKWIIRFKEIE